MSSEKRFFNAVASRRLIRPAVRAIVQSNLGFLVQRPTDSPGGHYAFIGGEYELGDDFHGRLRKEFEEETSARVTASEYLFVVENRFLSGGNIIQTLEHYFQVRLDTDQVRSRERHLEQVWLPAAYFAHADVRPAIVRDVVATGQWQNIRHLTVELPDFDRSAGAERPKS